VAWQSGSEGTRPCVEVRRVGESDWRRQAARSIVAAAPKGFLHHCEIEGLDPGSEYEYRVSSEAGVEAAWSGVQRARTAASAGEGPSTVAFFADTAVAGRRDGCSAAMMRVVGELAADDPFLLIGGGDYVYADTDERFLDPAEAIDAWYEQMEPVFTRSIFMPTFGNHDVGLGERYSDWIPRLFWPPGEDDVQSRSFDLGDAHFCALFAPGEAPDHRELEWLERDLAGSRAQGARWLIVYQHAPLFAYGTSHPARAEVREALLPIFERHRVDLHLSAHDQSYERTAPLCESGSKRAAPISPGSASYRVGEGVLYVKVSPFGKLSNRGGSFSHLGAAPGDEIVVRNDDCHHYALLRIEPDRLEVEIVGVPEDPGPRRQVDRFVIERD